MQAQARVRDCSYWDQRLHGLTPLKAALVLETRGSEESEGREDVGREDGSHWLGPSVTSQVLQDAALKRCTLREEARSQDFEHDEKIWGCIGQRMKDNGAALFRARTCVSLSLTQRPPTRRPRVNSFLPSETLPGCRSQGS